MNNFKITSKIPKFKSFILEADAIYLRCTDLDGYLTIDNLEGHLDCKTKYNVIIDIARIESTKDLLFFCRKYKSPPFIMDIFDCCNVLINDITAKMDDIIAKIKINDIMAKIKEFKNCYDIVVMLQRNEFQQLNELISVIYADTGVGDLDTIQLAIGYLNSVFKENLPKPERVIFEYSNPLSVNILPSTVDNLLQLAYYFLFDEIKMGKFTGSHCVVCNKPFQPVKRQRYCNDCQSIRNCIKSKNYYDNKGKNKRQEKRKVKKASND